MFIKFSFHCIIISFKNTYPRQGYLNNLVISIFRTFPSCAFYLTEVSTHQLTAINYQSVALLSLLKNIKQNQKKKEKTQKRNCLQPLSDSQCLQVMLVHQPKVHSKGTPSNDSNKKKHPTREPFTKILFSESKLKVALNNTKDTIHLITFHKAEQNSFMCVAYASSVFWCHGTV